MNQIIRATVSPRMMEKVDRLFNQSTTDIIPELFQNARRAGATSISVTTGRDGANDWLTIQDNGKGIQDPLRIITFGESDWSKPTLEAEDPAGMGFFSMAGRAIEVMSRSSTCEMGWHACISPSAWRGETDISVSPATCPVGTSITLPITREEALRIDYTIRNAGTYLPLDVIYEGKRIERRNFLGGAVHVEIWKGCRIGIYDCNVSSRARINFHGHQVEAKTLPTLQYVEGPTFYALVDMGPANDIQLVLPARKEVVQNDAYADLQQACYRALFKAIACQPHHRLSFHDWQRALSLDIDLPEARAELRPWCAFDTRGNDLAYNDRQPIEPDAKLMVVTSALMANCIDRVLREQQCAIPFYKPCDQYRGYQWYDQLPTIIDAKMLVRGEDFSIELGQEQEDHPDICDWSSGKAEAITLQLDQLDHLGKQTSISLPATLAAGLTDNILPDVERLMIYWTPQAATDIPSVQYTLQNGTFSPCDGPDDDSYETQQYDFEVDLRTHLVAMMLTPVAAAQFELQRILDKHRGLIPPGYQFTIDMDQSAAKLTIIAKGEVN